MEGEEGDKIFFIVSGQVCVVHRETHTYLEDLSVNIQVLYILFRRMTTLEKCASFLIN